MRYLTLQAANAFTFTCPIFNVETKMAACVKLRNMIWRGERIEVRRGCQACVASSKCPAAIIVQRMALTNASLPDDYGSREPVSGKIRADVLERILPVVVQQTYVTRFSVPEAEVALIETANERIAKQLGHAPKASTTPARNYAASKRSAPKKAAPVTEQPTAVQSAAASGDLSAAINGEQK